MLLLLQLCLSPVSGLPSSCPCVPAPACAWSPYGSHPLDIALLGIHPPCPEYGEVRCCDKAAFSRYYEDYAAEILKSPNSSREEISDAISDDKDDLLMYETSNSWDNPTATMKHQSISASDEVLCGCLKKSVCPLEFWNLDSGHCEESLVMCCVGKHGPNSDSKLKSKQLENSIRAKAEEENIESAYEFVHENLHMTSTSAAADMTTPTKAKFTDDVTDDANPWVNPRVPVNATVTSNSGTSYRLSSKRFLSIIPLLFRLFSGGQVSNPRQEGPAGSGPAPRRHDRAVPGLV